MDPPKSQSQQSTQAAPRERIHSSLDQTPDMEEEEKKDASLEEACYGLGGNADENDAAVAHAPDSRGRKKSGSSSEFVLVPPPGPVVAVSGVLRQSNLGVSRRRDALENYRTRISGSAAVAPLLQQRQHQQRSPPTLISLSPNSTLRKVELIPPVGIGGGGSLSPQQPEDRSIPPEGPALKFFDAAASTKALMEFARDVPVPDK